MKAQDLKNSIIQLAIQGKLVEQNPSDEPASVLLEKIKVEKEKLIKEKRIKREKPLPEISEEEKPFEIPDSWEWIRFGEVFNIVSSRRVHQSEWRKEGVPFYRAREIGKLAEFGKVDNELFIDNELYERYSQIGVPKAGDLMVTAVGTLGKTYIVKENERFYYKDASVICLENYSKLSSKYIKLVFESELLKNQIRSNSSGTTVATLTMVRMKEYILPLPPLEEQKRIVAKIEEVLEKIEEYDNAEKELSELEKAFPQDMKKSILQYAIQGKLVEQNSNDEPASILLEKIKAEKEQLIKEKKIKKEKPLPEISEEEKPFDIPDSWEWVRLSDCVKNIKGVTFKKNEVRQEKKEGYDFILRGGNINPQTGEIELIDNIYIPKGIIKDEQYIEVGDTLMVASSGTKSSIAKSTYIDKVINDTSVGAFLFIIRPYESMCSKYINLVIRYIRQKIINTTSGTNISNVSKGSLDSMVIPLPPLEEQKRIVDKVEKLLNYVDRLQNRIDNQNLINKIVKAKSIDISESKELINN